MSQKSKKARKEILDAINLNVVRIESPIIKKWLEAALLLDEAESLLSDDRYSSRLRTARANCWTSLRSCIYINKRKIKLAKNKLKEKTLTLEDPFEDWIVNHPSEVAAHAGKAIAIHLQKGIVASSNSIILTARLAAEKHVPSNEILIHVVPSVL